MVAFIASLLITGLLTGVILAVARRRAPGQYLTWGEAFVAATFMTGYFLLIYGIVPNQWLLWADNELQWRKDQFFFGDAGLNVFGRGRILLPKEALRDIVATVIYGAAIVGHIVGWLWWQRRGKKATSTAVETSRFGRPLLRQVD